MNNKVKIIGISIFLLLLTVMVAVVIYFGVNRNQNIGSKAAAPCYGWSSSSQSSGEGSKAWANGTAFNHCTEVITVYLYRFWCSQRNIAEGGMCGSNPNNNTDSLNPGQEKSYSLEQLVGNTGSCGSAQVDITLKNPWSANPEVTQLAGLAYSQDNDCTAALRCNDTCDATHKCPSNLTCDTTSGKCRNASCSNQTSCICPGPVGVCQKVTASKALTDIKIGDTITFTGWGSIDAASTDTIDKISFTILKDNVPVQDPTIVTTVLDPDLTTSLIKYYKGSMNYTINMAGSYSVVIKVHQSSSPPDEWKL